ncbi:hypothetical protein DID78_02810 [Candidatus Marinamargulisbacteria bacterium SCGC AG-343-D04]|nr:hypothetical protein DID78_02810 [Candidatus Marinamargulisbacteria bacterium SCGC AG-343-D04]
MGEANPAYDFHVSSLETNQAQLNVSDVFYINSRFSIMNSSPTALLDVFVPEAEAHQSLLNVVSNAGGDPLKLRDGFLSVGNYDSPNFGNSSPKASSAGVRGVTESIQLAIRGKIGIGDTLTAFDAGDPGLHVRHHTSDVSSGLILAPFIESDCNSRACRDLEEAEEDAKDNFKSKCDTAVTGFKDQYTLVMTSLSTVFGLGTDNANFIMCLAILDAYVASGNIMNTAVPSGGDTASITFGVGTVATKANSHGGQTFTGTLVWKVSDSNDVATIEQGIMEAAGLKDLYDAWQTAKNNSTQAFSSPSGLVFFGDMFSIRKDNQELMTVKKNLPDFGGRPTHNLTVSLMSRDSKAKLFVDRISETDNFLKIGENVLFVGADSRVGIGTDVPSGDFHIKGKLKAESLSKTNTVTVPSINIIDKHVVTDKLSPFHYQPINFPNSGPAMTYEQSYFYFRESGNPNDFNYAHWDRSQNITQNITVSHNYRLEEAFSGFSIDSTLTEDSNQNIYGFYIDIEDVLNASDFKSGVKTAQALYGVYVDVSDMEVFEQQGSGAYAAVFKGFKDNIVDAKVVIDLTNGGDLGTYLNYNNDVSFHVSTNRYVKECFAQQPAPNRDGDPSTTIFVTTNTLLCQDNIRYDYPLNIFPEKHPKPGTSFFAFENGAVDAFTFGAQTQVDDIDKNALILQYSGQSEFRSIIDAENAQGATNTITANRVANDLMLKIDKYAFMNILRDDNVDTSSAIMDYLAAKNIVKEILILPHKGKYRFLHTPSPNTTLEQLENLWEDNNVGNFVEGISSRNILSVLSAYLNQEVYHFTLTANRRAMNHAVSLKAGKMIPLAISTGTYPLYREGANIGRVGINVMASSNHFANDNGMFNATLLIGGKYEAGVTNNVYQAGADGADSYQCYTAVGALIAVPNEAQRAICFTDESGYYADYPDGHDLSDPELGSTANKFIEKDQLTVSNYMVGATTYKVMSKKTRFSDVRLGGYTPASGTVDAEPGELLFSGGNCYSELSSESDCSENKDFFSMTRENPNFIKDSRVFSSHLKLHLFDKADSTDIRFEAGFWESGSDKDDKFQSVLMVGAFKHPDKTNVASFVGIGDDFNSVKLPQSALHVRGAAVSGNLPFNYISMFENTRENSAGFYERNDRYSAENPFPPLNDYAIAAPNALALTFSSNLSPEEGGNYISFLFRSAGSTVPQRLGSIEGNENGHLQFSSPERDYAEYLEKKNPQEIMNAGDVVGIFGGKVSLETKGADHVMVLSSSPIIIGNWPGDDLQHLYSLVAFLGQVPVKVYGVVNKGDILVASGLGDGSAYAVSSHLIGVDHINSIIGRAWDSFSGEGVGYVNTVVGFPFNVRIIHEQLNFLEEKIGDYENKTNELEGLFRKTLEKQETLLESLEVTLK